MPLNPAPAAAHIRRLWPSERELLRSHMLRLDSTSRHHRFGRAVDDGFLADYADACFGFGDLVFGAFIDGVMHGAAELRSGYVIAIERAAVGAHRSAESAFSVEPEWRRRGVGRALFHRVLRAARNHGVETVDVFCGPENWAMMKLAREFSERFEIDHDQAAATIRVRAPTALSLAAEVGGDWLDMLGAALGAQQRCAEAAFGWVRAAARSSSP